MNLFYSINAHRLLIKKRIFFRYNNSRYEFPQLSLGDECELKSGRSLNLRKPLALLMGGST